MEVRVWEEVGRGEWLFVWVVWGRCGERCWWVEVVMGGSCVLLVCVGFGGFFICVFCWICLVYVGGWVGGGWGRGVGIRGMGRR